MFSPLRQPAFFIKNFKVEQGGYGIVWNEEIDLSEYELWKNGVPLAESEDVAGDSIQQLECDRSYNISNRSSLPTNHRLA